MGLADCLCMSCQSQLPLAKENLEQHARLNDVMARLNIKEYESFLNYWKGNVAYKLIHALKYKGNKKVSSYLADIYIDSSSYHIHEKEWDIIATVPLHKKRERNRGYNQMEDFAYQLSNDRSTYIKDFLIRKKHAKSQTTRNREQRLESLKHTFTLNKTYQATNLSRILLIDDVFTTGGTAIACTKAVREFFPNIELGWLFMAQSI